MTKLLELNAAPREVSGKALAKRCRKDDKIPAIIYGRNKQSIAVEVEKKSLVVAAQHLGFMSQPILLKMPNESYQIIPRAIQLHPVTDQIQHIDFIFADNKEAVRVTVAFKFVNRDKAPALKKGGRLNIILRSVDLLCKPKDAPSCITIDLSIFNIGDRLKERDLVLPAGVSLYNPKKNRTILTVIGKNKEAQEEEQAS